MSSTAVQEPFGHSTTFQPLEPVVAGSKKHHVHTTLNYHKESEDGSAPAPSYAGQAQSFERPVETLDATVHDISGETEKYTLDRNGFQIYNHTSAEKDFLDEDKIKAAYYAETEQLLKDA